MTYKLPKRKLPWTPSVLWRRDGESISEWQAWLRRCVAHLERELAKTGTELLREEHLRETIREAERRVAGQGGLSPHKTQARN